MNRRSTSARRRGLVTDSDWQATATTATICIPSLSLSLMLPLDCHARAIKELCFQIAGADAFAPSCSPLRSL